MMYQFTRNQIVIVVLCLAVLGFLTFSAGVLAGLGLAMPTRQELAMLKAGKPPAIAASALPQVPAAPAAIGALGAKLAAPAPAATVEQAPPAATPETAPPATPVSSAPAPVSAAATPATQTAQEAPVMPAAPTRAAPTPSGAVSAPPESEFALQLGSFRDLNRAKQLQSDMKDRGYSTSILTALDADQREWHVVRIDGFKTLASASQAAAELIGKERIPAVVRRSKAL